MEDFLIAFGGALLSGFGYVLSLIQSVIKSRYDLKIKRMEVYETRKLDAISEFLFHAETAVRSKNSMVSVRNSFSSALIFMDKKQAKIAFRLRDCLDAGDTEGARAALDDLSISLQEND